MQRMEEINHHPSPIVTVDVVLFTLDGECLKVLLNRRSQGPYEGVRALPGGYVHPQEDEDLADSARRVLAQKADLKAGYFLEQLATFSGLARDPRGWSVSVAYYAVVPIGFVPISVFDQFVPVESAVNLPFDHERILAVALERLRGKSSYSSLPAFLLPERFAFGDLQSVYEAVMGVKVDGASFRRKIDEKNMIVPVEGDMRRAAGRGRSSQMYRLTEPTLKQYTRVLS